MKKIILLVPVLLTHVLFGQCPLKLNDLESICNSTDTLLRMEVIGRGFSYVDEWEAIPAEPGDSSEFMLNEKYTCDVKRDNGSRDVVFLMKNDKAERSFLAFSTTDGSYYSALRSQLLNNGYQFVQHVNKAPGNESADGYFLEIDYFTNGLYTVSVSVTRRMTFEFYSHIITRGQVIPDDFPRN